MKVSIEARNLSLVVPYFVQPERPASSWLSTLVGAATSVPRRRFATLIDDMSFALREGDRVALIGRNGAGKSTLLRVLSGAFEPTTGSLKVEGSRQAMLSTGMGFNSEATIVENIFLRATAMGVSASEIHKLVEPVLEFSGLREVANRRLFTLSSGQRVRLGFAISTAVRTDVLLLDEWFGAGDAQFMRKARRRMMDRVEGSKIVVIATHSDKLLRKFCNRALLIDGGRLVMDGPVDDVLAKYRQMHPRLDPIEIKRKKREKRAKLKARRARRLAANQAKAAAVEGTATTGSIAVATEPPLGSQTHAAAKRAADAVGAGTATPAEEGGASARGRPVSRP
jgi:homopolymeric O-antigen transport system ATP-binding protein